MRCRSRNSQRLPEVEEPIMQSETHLICSPPTQIPKWYNRKVNNILIKHSVVHVFSDRTLTVSPYFTQTYKMTLPNQTKPFTIAIVGGGLGGLLLALGLSIRNVPFHIYESAPAFTETSAGIGVGPNAVRAMALLDPRITEFYDDLCTENGWETKRDSWFEFRMGESEGLDLVTVLKLKGENEKQEARQHRTGNVLRARMLEELVKLLPKECTSFEKRVESVKEVNGKVTLRFADGTEEFVDAVVGCDGIRSVMRGQLLGKEHEASKAVFSKMYVYRGLLDMKVAIDAVGEELAMNSQVYMGHGGMVVTYPIENGRVLNVVAFKQSEDDTWEHDKWVVESSKEDFMKDFEEFGERVRNLLKVSAS
jgi:salicylate hydroxylase